MEIENASPGKRMPFLLKLLNSRGISLNFSHLCLASDILYVTRHAVSFRLGASRPEYKERDREFKEFDNATENLTHATRVQKTRPRTMPRGPKYYLSAHRDQKNKNRI